MYKAGAKAENSHIDVQNLKTAVTVVQLPKVDPENFTSDKFRGGGYNPRNPPLHTGLGSATATLPENRDQHPEEHHERTIPTNPRQAAHSISEVSHITIQLWHVYSRIQ